MANLPVPDAMSPPRAPLAFRVGVVGHRPDRLPKDSAGLDAISARLAQVLAAVARGVHRFADTPDGAFYAPGPPILRAVSPLAEGADRLFAREALAQGFELCSVMPFAQAHFEADFCPPFAMAEDALSGFHRLLDRAQTEGRLTRFEMDGAASRRSEAYHAAGRVVLNQSDLLVVVWDGGAANGLGGTLDTLRQAVEFDVPALWIDARAPYGWQLVQSREDLERLDSDDACPPASAARAGPADTLEMNTALEALVADELALPLGDQDDRSHLRHYLGETRPAFNLAIAWKMFRNLMDHGFPRMPALRVTDYIQQIDYDWPLRSADAARGDPEAVFSWLNGTLRSHYAWSDKLADRYADAHRSAFVWTSLLAATTVFLALLPMACGWGPRRTLTWIDASVETFVLLAMVVLPVIGRRRRWHQKWMEYRVLAEMVRELRVLIPLGGGRPLPRTPAHLANYGDPTQSWMYWQTRALARAVGVPDTAVDERYVQAQVEHLLALLGMAPGHNAPGSGQIGFHYGSSERDEKIHRRLHKLTLILFGLTIAGVIVHWLTPMFGPQEPIWLGRWLVLTSAVFPAFGAAMAAINNQAEFARIQRRSRAMADGLQTLTGKISALRGQDATLSTITDLASKITTMMVAENIDWRIVVLDVPHVAG